MSAGCSQHHPRRILGTREIRILIQSGQKGLLTPLDSNVALNASWARRAGVISCLPRSVRVASAATPGHPCRMESHEVARHTNRESWHTPSGIKLARVCHQGTF